MRPLSGPAATKPRASLPDPKYAAVVALANAALLVLFRLGPIAAGPFGAAAVPFLFLHFFACGALCAIAAASVLRRLPIVVLAPLVSVAGVTGFIGSFRVWAYGPNPGAFLGRLFGWAVVPAVVWAVTSTKPRRPVAVVVAAGMAALWVVAVISGQ